MRSEFEKAYSPNPHKSPFTEVRFNDEKQIYEPLNPPLDHVARSLNAAWYGYRIRQTEVDELQCEVKRINLWYSNVKLQLENKEIDSAIDAKKIDELQRRNQMLNDNIKEQGQKLVYQNEVIETQAEKLLCLRDEKAELQKRVDAVKQLIQEYRDPPTEDKTFCHALSIVADELEQALKGGLDE